MTVGVIGGSGFQDWEPLAGGAITRVSTPYADEPVPLLRGTLEGREVAFLARHGAGHSIPPHRVNYRANIWALKHSGVHAVVAIATVGGISPEAAPGSLIIPDQMLDYTHGRAHTFFDGADGVVAHADMTEPYCQGVRQCLISTASRLGIAVAEHGTYAATQGPRFETPAEITRLERDGADIVGMTGMPEAGLAKELELPYAVIALVANSAAGKAGGGISMDEIRGVLGAARSQVETLLAAAVPDIDAATFHVPPPMRP